MCDHEYCDDCGCRVYPKARCVVESLPCDIASANEGESATPVPPLLRHRDGTVRTCA